MDIVARTCGSCTFCCKVMEIEELAKPASTWCRHVRPSAAGGGCAIYGAHPPSCRAFACQWLLEPAMPAKFRPDRSKVVLTAEAGPMGTRLIANCDMNNPLAWRREPMYASLKQQAARTWPTEATVLAKAGRHLWLVTPTKPVDMGEVHDRSPYGIDKRPDGSAQVHIFAPDDPGMSTLRIAG